MINFSVFIDLNPFLIEEPGGKKWRKYVENIQKY